MHELKSKKEWHKPQVMDLGAEMTQYNLLGSGQDGSWQDNDVADAPAGILGGS